MAPDFLDSVQDPRIVDPLSEVTRRERKALMLASLVALAVTRGGLIPSEINALGITISAFERMSLLYLLALALLYFILGFTLYAAADLKAYRVKVLGVTRSRKSQVEEALGPKISAKKEEMVSRAVEQRDYSALDKLAQLADSSQAAEDVLNLSRLRYLFEFYLPILVGGGALVLTLEQTWGHRGSGLMTALAVAVGLAMVVGYFWQARKRIQRKWQSWNRNRPMRRLRKRTRRATKLPEGSERKKQAVEEINRLLKEMGKPRERPPRGKR